MGTDREARQAARAEREAARRAALTPEQRAVEDHNRIVAVFREDARRRSDAMTMGTLDLPTVDLSTYGSGTVTTVWRQDHLYDRHPKLPLLILPNIRVRPLSGGGYDATAWWTGHRDESGDVCVLARLPLTDVRVDLLTDTSMDITATIPAGQADACAWYKGDPTDESERIPGGRWSYFPPHRPAEYQQLIGTCVMITTRGET